MGTIVHKGRLLNLALAVFISFLATGSLALSQIAPGTYTVGSGGNYSTLTAAVSALNSTGVSGAVTFSLISTSYSTSTGETFPISINTTSAPAGNRPDSAGGRWVTFKPAAGVTTIITGAPTTHTDPIIKIFTTNAIIFDGSNTTGGTTRNLTIQNTVPDSGSGAKIFWLGSNGTTTPIKNITIKNCNLIQATPYSGATIIICDGNTAGNTGAFENVTIQNNNIQKGIYGVYANCASGTSTAQNGFTLTVINNNISGCRQYGVSIFGVSWASIRKNEIDSLDPRTPTEVDAGIGLGQATINSSVDSNKIHDLFYTGGQGSGPKGIAVNTGFGTTNPANDTVANNMISHITGDGDSVGNTAQQCPVGIYLGAGTGNGAGQTGIHIYYNSIYLYGNTLNRAKSSSFGIALDAGRANIKNNIVVNKLGLASGVGRYCVAIEASNGNNQFLSIDYNDYFPHATTCPNYVGLIGSTLYSTVSAFASGSLGDTHSVTDSVTFAVSPSDSSNLDLAGSSIGDHGLIGTPIPGITTDYHGNPRSSTFPYMGANEGAISLPVTLVSFTAQSMADALGTSLQWTTLSEVNNYGFYIQRRSQNVPQFAELPGSFTAGHGTTIQPHQYSYTDKSVPGPGIYYYRLRQVDLDGTVHFSDPAQVNLTVLSVGETVPAQFALLQNYPNPFNPETEIRFSVERLGRATLEVYNILGQRVATLFDGIAEPGRFYRVKFNGLSVASGLYFYKLQSGTRSDLKKMILLK